MINLIRHNHRYFLPYFALLFGSLLLLLFIEKGEEVIWLNQFYNDSMNWIFKWSTKLGEVWVGIIIGIAILLKYPFRSFCAFIIVLVLESILVQFFKNVLFSDAVRPKIFLEEHSLRFVEDLYINTMHSFPSGHTAASFVFFTFLALLADPKWKPWLLIFPLLTGLSRIYLAQHFLLDVVVGSIIGAILSLIVFWFFHRNDFLTSDFWRRKLFSS